MTKLPPRPPSQQPPVSRPLGQPTPGAPAAPAGFIPPPITRVEDTGLSHLWLQDLVLKIMYFEGYLTGF